MNIQVLSHNFKHMELDVFFEQPQMLYQIIL